jgi:hypothetical protein
MDGYTCLYVLCHLLLLFPLPADRVYKLLPAKARANLTWSLVGPKRRDVVTCIDAVERKAISAGSGVSSAGHVQLIPPHHIHHLARGSPGSPCRSSTLHTLDTDTRRYSRRTSRVCGAGWMVWERQQ